MGVKCLPRDGLMEPTRSKIQDFFQTVPLSSLIGLGGVSILKTLAFNLLRMRDWTERDDDTVNKIPANGGSLNSAGVTIVDGWLSFTSGYGFNGMPGNVMLAFGPPQGK